MVEVAEVLVFAFVIIGCIVAAACSFPPY